MEAMYSKPPRTFNVISVINIIILFHLLSLPSLNDNLDAIPKLE